MVTERRKSQRHDAKNLIALTSKGVAQVANLSTKNISIRFTKNVHFPDYSVIDLYDATGLNMVEVVAKKVWSKTLDDQSGYKLFRSEIGAEFENLTPSQESQLKSYLRQQNEKTSL
jgi:hypothetical protein